MASATIPLRAVGAAELLQALDGPASGPVARALSLLAQATGLSEEQVARWSVGKRDAQLLRLRARLLGPTLQAVVACPDCGESVETVFPFDAVLTGPEDPQPPPPLAIRGVPFELRLPTSEDQLALAACGDADTARRELLRRCLGGDPSALDGPALEAVAAAMSDSDPDADIQLALTCPACGQAWSQSLDVPAFVLAEAQTLAQRLLEEVHLLASAYGWSERDILALSTWRRRAYLDLVLS